MSDSENKPTLGRKPLGLKKSVEAGEVKQTFSHGRTNKVVVEVKSRKLIRKPGEAPVAAPAPPPPPPPAPVAAPAPAPAPKKPAAPAGETPQERVARLQREAEEARLALLEEQTRRETEERQRALEEERRRAEENRKAEAKAAAQAAAAAAAPAVEEPAAEPAAAPAPAAEEAPSTGAAASAPAPRRFTPVAALKRPEPPAKKSAHPRDKTGGERRHAGKLTVTKALNEDEGARARSLAALKRAREKERRAHFAGQSQPREKQVRDVVVPEAITVQELANRMAEKGADLVKALFKMGMMVTVNQTIDADTAELLVEEFGHNIQRVSESDVDIDTTSDVDAEDTLKPRPPVVAIMGHVDHGKTSLLDALRERRTDRADGGADARVLGDAPGIVLGHVQVGTDKDALALGLAAADRRDSRAYVRRR